MEEMGLPRAYLVEAIEDDEKPDHSPNAT